MPKMELTIKLKTREPENVRVFKLLRRGGYNNESLQSHLFFCLDDFEIINPDIHNLIINNNHIYEVPGLYGDISTRWVRIGNLQILRENERDSDSNVALNSIFDYLTYGVSRSCLQKIKSNTSKIASIFVEKELNRPEN